MDIKKALFIKKIVDRKISQIRENSKTCGTSSCAMVCVACAGM